MPIILTTIAVATAAYGVKEGVGAYANNRKAGSLHKKAHAKYTAAEKKLNKARQATQDALVGLGEAKLSTWDRQMGRFVQLFELLKNVELEGQPLAENLVFDPPSREELDAMKKVTIEAGDLAKGGFQALGTGALVGLASYGGAMTFASASTGTAIASLSGAAAKSATLAWFGGGSLASGGMGMAGGMMVLGGLVAGPVLAVGGVVLAAKSRKNVAKAKKNFALARQAVAQMETARTVVKGIERIAHLWQESIDALAVRMDRALDDLARVIREQGTDYSAFSPKDRQRVFVAVQFAQVTKLLLETPLLTEEGSLADEGTHALEQAQRFLDETGSSNA